MNAFQKVFGDKCKRKWAGNQAMSIRVREGNSCTYRSSVVADSSDQYADQGMVATTTVGGGTKKLQAKSFVGVGVRRSDTAGYVLRILPNKHKWQYFRDPKGAAGLEARGLRAAASSSSSAPSRTWSRFAPSRAAARPPA